jgi:phosphoglycerol transferase MdoB-like AlkP superfamily enzyme
MYRHWFFDNYYNNAADAIRGIPDNDINADYMLSLNLDLNFLVFKLRTSELFPNSRFMRLFDADIHVVPILDLGIFNDPVTQSSFSVENLLIGTGFELIVFSARWRSLYFRGSAAIGMQPGNPNAGISREIYIGADFHY